MGARRWEAGPRRHSVRRRRMERAVLGPVLWIVAVALDRRLRRALAR